MQPLQTRRRYGTFGASLEGRERVLCWLVARKHRLDIVYAKSGAVRESVFVKDVSGVRRLGSGDYKSELRTQDDADAAVRLLELICKGQARQHRGRGSRSGAPPAARIAAFRRAR